MAVSPWNGHSWSRFTGYSRNGRMQSAAKHETMHKHGSNSGAVGSELITAPAYPFTARELFGNLRGLLSEARREPMSYDRLAKIVGKSKSTTHHWFELFAHPHVLAFMCLLERLSPAQRHDYIEAHCRIFPTLNHPILANSPKEVAKLLLLLNQSAGLTIVTGGRESSRTFVLTALGHTQRGSVGSRQRVAGLDLHRPRNFVPVESVTYIDGSIGLKHVRQLTLRVWTRILTSKAPIMLFNGVWSAVPQVREDLVRCTKLKHVVIAEEAIPHLADLKRRVTTPIHVLTLSAAKHVCGGIRIDCRGVKRAKMEQN